jgi:translation initiation factor 2 beta subunit (eIF-2beta)/eIF-5
MIDRVTVPVAGTCPKCGNPDIAVPESFDDETIIKCAACGHNAPYATFFTTPET